MRKYLNKRPIKVDVKFQDNEKVKGIPNDIFQFSHNTINHFYVSRILTDSGSFYDIMYLELFEKMCLKKENLWLYEGFNFQAFNNTLTHP